MFQRPRLIIIAGRNGAGKSTYSHLFVNGITPFDYDKRFLEIYSSMPDSELREKIADNRTIRELEDSIETAFSNRNSICFETNFHVFPQNWINQAKALKYYVEIIFFCLNSIELAKERVEIRTKNQGHFVSDEIIKHKWKAGYNNINKHYDLFDYLLFIDNSDEIPVPIFQMDRRPRNEYIIERLVPELPSYTERRLPDIFNMISPAR